MKKIALLTIFLFACNKGTPTAPDEGGNFDIPDNLPNRLPIEVVHNDATLTAFGMGPQLVRGGSEDYVLRGNITFNRAGFIRTISVFHGVDRGDIVEMDTEIRYGVDPLVLRSDHKEILDNFDAWGDSPYVINRAVRNISIALTCRVTGKQGDPDHPRYGSFTARPHWGILVDWKTEEENEASDPSPVHAFAWWDTYFRSK